MDIFTNVEKIIPIISEFLEKAKIQSADTIRDDNKYKQCVVDPIWEAMPFVVRMIGRDRLKWDKIFELLRTNAFTIEGEKVRINAEALQDLKKLIQNVWETKNIQSGDV